MLTCTAQLPRGFIFNITLFLELTLTLEQIALLSSMNPGLTLFDGASGVNIQNTAMFIQVHGDAAPMMLKGLYSLHQIPPTLLSCL